MLIETITSLLMLSIAFSFIMPSELTMPMSIQSMLLISLVIAFIVFAGLILKEHPQDERESLHIMMASRIAYLFGIGAIIVAIIFQTIQHNVDPALIIVVAVMIISKIIARIYCQYKM